jgi:hypothetical protein
MSVDGIYRPWEGAARLVPLSDGAAPVSGVAPASIPDVVLRPKDRLPTHGLAYVGEPSDPHTWRLPLRSSDGAPDPRRLPEAIQGIRGSHRGPKVDRIPDERFRPSSASSPGGG